MFYFFHSKWLKSLAFASYPQHIEKRWLCRVVVDYYMIAFKGIAKFMLLAIGYQQSQF